MRSGSGLGHQTKWIEMARNEEGGGNKDVFSCELLA